MFSFHEFWNSSWETSITLIATLKTALILISKDRPSDLVLIDDKVFKLNWISLPIWDKFAFVQLLFSSLRLAETTSKFSEEHPLRSAFLEIILEEFNVSFSLVICAVELHSKITRFIVTLIVRLWPFVWILLQHPVHISITQVKSNKDKPRLWTNKLGQSWSGPLWSQQRFGNLYFEFLS